VHHRQLIAVGGRSAQEDEPDGRESKQPDHYYREPRKVLLHYGRAREGAPRASAQGRGEPPALAGVQEDQANERHAEDCV
jgi:hypothetical protein